MYKILIRPLVENDSEVSWRWRNDEAVWNFTGKRPSVFVTAEIERNWIKRVLLEATSKRFAIIVDDTYVGNIQLSDITLTDAQYHIFIGDKRYWGKGVAFLASQQLIRYAKNVLKIRRLYLYVNPGHDNAIKLYQKCGFVQVSNDIQMVLDLKKAKAPKVSVFCMVYNHESFLEQCLNGILMQKCLFDFDIVVGEDCSSDRSREILLEYQSRFPGKFKLLLHETNVGAAKNQNTVFACCEGKYIAMCEGDDYWIDSSKLQLQVEFLERNRDFSICFTNYLLFDENKKKFFKSKLSNNFKYKGDLQLKDIIRKNFIGTCTVLFKKNFNFIPDSFELMYPGDWPLHILNASYGKIKYLPFESGVYRLHKGGTCSSAIPINNYLRYLDMLSKVESIIINSNTSLRFSFIIARLNIYKDILLSYFKIFYLKWVK